MHTQGFPLVLEFALYIYVRACDAVEYVNKLALKKVEKKFDGENGVCFDCGIIKPTNTQPTHTQPTNNRK